MWAGDVLEEFEIDEEDEDQTDRMFAFEVTKTNEQEESVVSRPGITVRRVSSGRFDAKYEQVDLSAIFPKPSVAGKRLTGPMPVFLSGEKKQAVRTSILTPPAKRVEKIYGEYNHTQLRNYLYDSSSLCGTTKLIR